MRCLVWLGGWVGGSRRQRRAVSCALAAMQLPPAAAAAAAIAVWRLGCSLRTLFCVPSLSWVLQEFQAAWRHLEADLGHESTEREIVQKQLAVQHNKASS